MALVYASTERLRIVTELWMREMSPQGYWAAFGGESSLKSVQRNFKLLTDYGWLRLVRTESLRDRRSRQRFFRATEPAVFDNETWCSLPYSIRFAFSCVTFEQLGERVIEAMQAGTFDSRDDRHLSWTSLTLDEQGWERVIGRVDAVFESLTEEQADAKVRLERCQEAPILMTVGLAGFLSPQSGLVGRGSLDPPIPLDLGPAVRLDSAIPFTMRLAKVFADPLNLKIVAETNLRAMSATELRQRIDPTQSLKVFERRTKVLENLGWVVKVDSKTGGRRRGASEHFYRASGPAIFDPDQWPHVPGNEKATISWRTFQQLSGKVREAMQGGTFDARCDRHWSWSLLRLDRVGWQQVISMVDGLFQFLFTEQEAARSRLARTGEEPVIATACLLGFESPLRS